MSNYLYYCSNCNSLVSDAYEDDMVTCEKCIKRMIPLHITEEEWVEMSDDAKKSLIAKHRTPVADKSRKRQKIVTGSASKDSKTGLLKCPNCGADIEKNSKVCSYCGSTISSDMRKEQELVMKEGCPKCGSSNIQFQRENQGEYIRKNGKTIIHRTVGVCKDCGYTWTPSNGASNTKSSTVGMIVLWALGWIYIFPVPLMILLKRKTNMDAKLKRGFIIAAWAVYAFFFMIAMFSPSGSSNNNIEKVAQEQDRSLPDSIDEQQETESNIRELSFSSDRDIQVETGKTAASYQSGYVNASVNNREDFSPEDVVFISDNPEVATVEFDHEALTTYLYFTVTGVSEGETYIYATTKDGSVSSPKRKVAVELSAADRRAMESAENDVTAATDNVEEADKIEETTKTTQMIASKTVNVRKEPNTDCDVIGKLSAGDSVETVEETETGWYKVKFNGEEGYVKSDYLTTEKEYLAQSSNQSNETVASADVMKIESTETAQSTGGTRAATGITSGTGGDGSNFDTYDIAEQQNTSETYVLNTSSLKIHHPSCNDVRKIKPENYATSSSTLDELRAQGYTTCGHCFR